MARLVPGPDQEVHRYTLCAECGARYDTPGLISMHRRATGHIGSKSRQELRPKRPTSIAYQPGFGPGRTRGRHATMAQRRRGLR